jgi:hypothetical protein
MKQQRAPFMPVTPDIDDEALESLAREKGVGALVKPVANRAGEAPRSEPKVSAQTDAELPSDEQQPTPRSRMKAVNIELPDYAWTELKIMAAREQVSVRHIVMTALKARGIEISDFDLIEDGRRLRN